MLALYSDYGGLLVAVHVFSAMIWIGGMILMRFVVYPAIQGFEEPRIRLPHALGIIGSFFHLVIPFIVLIFATGLMMAIALSGHEGAMKTEFIIKESIWVIMVLNFALMYLLRAKAARHYRERRHKEAKEVMRYLPNLLLPINIVLGIVALWFGVILRGL
jgi:uncharacterized membrane protein